MPAIQPKMVAQHTCRPAMPGPPVPAFGGARSQPPLQARMRPGAVVQRMESITSDSSSGLRDVFSNDEIQKAKSKAQTPMRTYNVLITNKPNDYVAKAQKMLDLVEKYSGFEIYVNQGNLQQGAEVWALFCHGPGHPYYAFPTSYGLPCKSKNAHLADGVYCFTILSEKRNEVRLCRDGEEIGHTSMTGGKEVIYAGKVTFENGNLILWNNDTGHYQTKKEDSIQGEVVPVDILTSPLLPVGKFKVHR